MSLLPSHFNNDKSAYTCSRLPHGTDVYRFLLLVKRHGKIKLSDPAPCQMYVIIFAGHEYIVPR